jgi:hypothetical protein
LRRENSSGSPMFHVKGDPTLFIPDEARCFQQPSLFLPVP